MQTAETTEARESVQELLRTYDEREPERLLRAVAERFPPGQVALASSLGPEDQVLTDLVARHGLAIPIFTLDTGRLFQETYDLIERTERHYGLRLRVYVPEREALEDLVARNGVNQFRQSVELRRACCRVRKVEPLRRALAGREAWVCGLRRQQSPLRGDLQAVEWDEANGLLKVNPLIDWTEEQVWDYVRANGVPVNALHEQGFRSIGCACCTRAVGPDEDVRAGRWWWEEPEHKECGLHWKDGKVVRAKD